MLCWSISSSMYYSTSFDGSVLWRKHGMCDRRASTKHWYRRNNSYRRFRSDRLSDMFGDNHRWIANLDAAQIKMRLNKVPLNPKRGGQARSKRTASEAFNEGANKRNESKPDVWYRGGCSSLNGVTRCGSNKDEAQTCVPQSYERGAFGDVAGLYELTKYGARTWGIWLHLVTSLTIQANSKICLSVTVGILSNT